MTHLAQKPAIRLTRLGAIAVLSLVAMFSATSQASATLAPESGPTIGATTVTDRVPAVTFASLAMGSTHSLAIGSDGHTYSWGLNGSGELGNGSTTGNMTPLRVAVPAGVTFTQLSAGYSHSLALGSDGNVYAWGSNEWGAVGNGATTDANKPVLITAPEGITFTEVAAGSFHSLALASDGSVYAWGNNFFGQLGSGSTANQPAPVRVVGPTGITFAAIVGGGQHSFALGSDGNFYGWGFNAYGQLGDGTTTNRSEPVIVTVPAGIRYTSIAAGNEHSSAIGSDGNVYSFGENSYGQLGDGTTTNSDTPVRVVTPPGASLVTVGAGAVNGYVLDSDGNVYAWGSNFYGQLGNGTNLDSELPIQISNPSGVTLTNLAPGRFASVMALGSDGNTYAWGDDFGGLLGGGLGGHYNPTPSPVRADVVVNQVMFGDQLATDLTFADGTWTAQTPAHTCGPVDVRVSSTQFGVTSTATQVNGFTFGAEPVVTTQPESAIIEEGSTFTATAQATGDDAPTLQWQAATSAAGPWADVDGATSETLSVQPTEKTHYRAVFANDCASNVYSEVVTASFPSDSVVPKPTVTPKSTAKPTPNDAVGPASEQADEVDAAALATTGDESRTVGLLVAGILFVLGLSALVLVRRNQSAA